MTTYRYHPLPQSRKQERWIRLLWLQPSRTPSDPIKIQLKHVLLESNTKYEALSYVWGDPGLTKEILVLGENGVQGSLQIRQNLFDALYAFRQSDVSMILWIDALCINQSDIQERNNQVSLMGRIYSGALTRVWLGTDPDRHAQKVFDIMKPFADMIWQNSDNAGSLEAMALSLDPSVWRNIRDLYQNPWFQRAWVQQEIGLSADWKFYWGDSDPCDHHTVLGFDAWLEAWGQEVKTRFDLDQAALLATRRNWISYGRSVHWSWGSGDTNHMAFLAESYFLMVMLESSACKASDPRDHVYAFLGHPSARRETAYQPGPIRDDQGFYRDLCEHGPPTLVQPDYTKSKEEVYIETARQLLLQHMDLRPLGAVAHTEQSLASSCPSWVPRWDLIASQTMIGCRQDHYPHKLWLLDAPPFRIIEGPLPRLEVYGLICGIVDDLLENFQDGIPSVLYKGRRMFRARGTELGDGIVQRVARVGDVVAILHGSFVPCIIRRVLRDEFKFVGTCFVQPLMSPGKANEIIEQRKSEVKKLILL